MMARLKKEWSNFNSLDYCAVGVLVIDAVALLATYFFLRAMGL